MALPGYFFSHVFKNPGPRTLDLPLVSGCRRGIELMIQVFKEYKELLYAFWKNLLDETTFKKGVSDIQKKLYKNSPRPLGHILV